MPPFLFPTEIESSLALLLLVAGAGLVLQQLVDLESRLHRSLLLGLSALLALRYLWWRGTETLAAPGLTADFLASGSLFLLEALTIVGSLSAFLILTRVRRRSAEADAHAGWWAPAPAPRVAVLIATFNEELAVLQRTVVGALALDYPNAEILVLDDGRRPWLAAYCAERGVRYLARPDNRHSKAGNLNHALAELARNPVPPDFVAILDADFVPHRDFLHRSLALFHAPEVGLVQTPQHFFNADPIQHNLGLSRAYPDEQRFFFDNLQPSRDAWGIPICCGTSSVVRWAALGAIGGVPTESVTEDFLLTLALAEAGWQTVYLDEVLSEGLAPEGLHEYITQRSRWCLGQMQIFRSRLGPFGQNGLSLRQRWSAADSLLYWVTTFPFRIAAFVYPLLFWFFNVTVVDATASEAIAYFGVHYAWSLLALNLLSQGKLVPVVVDASQLVGAIPITRAAIAGLLFPGRGRFRVTAKGGNRSRTVIQWDLIRDFGVLIALTVTGLAVGIFSDRFAHFDAGSGKVVVLFWTLYNLLVLAVTLLICIELPRDERHVADAPERAVLRLDDGTAHRVWLASLALDVTRIRGAGRYRTGDRGVLRVRDVGEIAVTVMDPTPDGCRLLLENAADQQDALIRRFYTEGSAPGVGSTRWLPFFEALARRVTTLPR